MTYIDSQLVPMFGTSSFVGPHKVKALRDKFGEKLTTMY
jgi:hypothetical protein